MALTEGPFWLCSHANFDRGAHPNILADVEEAIGDPEAANHQHVSNTFIRNILTPTLPAGWLWKLGFSFGTASRIYRSLRGALLHPVARAFDLQHDVFESWLHALSFGRNVCAHHCRVWNRSFTIKPKIPKDRRELWPQHSRKLYVLVCLILTHMQSSLMIAIGRRDYVG